MLRNWSRSAFSREGSRTRSATPLLGQHQHLEHRAHLRGIHGDRARNEGKDRPHSGADEVGRRENGVGRPACHGLFQAFPPRKESVDLNVVIEEALRLSLSTLRTREIAVLKDLAPDIAPCRVDAQLIEQVLVNLITNACQAMEGGEGRNCSRSRPPFRTAGSSFVCPTRGREFPFHPEKVFDPFFTTRKEGSGIGLSFSHRIVSDHGGSLRVDASRWGGAEFRIELPAAREGVSA